MSTENEPSQTPPPEAAGEPSPITAPAPATAPALGTQIVENLARNAMPLTAMLVAMVELSGGMSLRVMRMRDSWLSNPNFKNNVDLPQVNLAFQIGGDLRGGPNGVLWARVRAHPLYVADADFEFPEPDMAKVLKDWAYASFYVPEACAKPCQFLWRYLNNIRQSPVDKLAEAMAINLGGVPPAEDLVDPRAVKRAVADLATRIEALRAEDKAKG